MEENRRTRRFLFDEEVEFISPREMKGRGIDLAEGGIGVIVPEEIPPDTIVVLKILEGHILLPGTVRWCRKEGKEIRVGIQFEKEDWQILERIASLREEAP